MSASKKRKFVIDSDNEQDVKVEIINKEQAKPSNEDVIKLKKQAEAIKLKKKEEEMRKPAKIKEPKIKSEKKEILGKRKAKDEVSLSYSSYSSSGSSSSSCSSGEESPKKKSEHKAKATEKPLNLSKKTDVVDELLCRWWYAMDMWPNQKDFQYNIYKERIKTTKPEKSRHN